MQDNRKRMKHIRHCQSQPGRSSISQQAVGQIVCVIIHQPQDLVSASDSEIPGFLIVRTTSEGDHIFFLLNKNLFFHSAQYPN